MYEKFFGLNEKPFQILSDPAYLFMSKTHESAYTYLEYGIMENKGFVVITGEIGSGKTTLINYLLEKIEGNFQTALINNTLIRPGNLIKMLCQDFEIDTRGLDDSELLTAFYQFLIQQYTEQKRVILIIDEAQNLSMEALEEIRMLSNFELDKQHLFQVILVGQPQLRFKLRQKVLEQLAQRVSVHYHISGLSAGEVKTYIQYRLQVAGSKNLNIFMEEAQEAIYIFSRGIPRLINILCDTALVYAFADGLKEVNREIIEAIIREREVGGFNDFDTGLDEACPPESDVAFVNPTQSVTSHLTIEQKVESFENRLEQIESKLSHIINEKENRNNLILDLFKLLQKNFEGRYQVLNKLLTTQKYKIIVKQ
jgi:general secretion pathway protein A